MMNLADLHPAPHAILTNLGAVDLRGQAYLRTYPHILNAASQPWPAADLFPVVADLAYGWMPRALQLDPNHFHNACVAYGQATIATPHNWLAVNIGAIKDCLHSMVGASKVLHFCNPGTFPIWDRKVESFRLQADATPHHMQTIQNYIDYALEVHAIADDPGFPAFSTNLVHAFDTRLAHLHIPPHAIGPLRIVDTAAFELA
jgi:hypothetical protein